MVHPYKDAAEVIVTLDETNPVQFAHIAEVFEVCREGERYSFHASDVISSAKRACEQNYRTIPDYMKGWVDYRSKQRVQVKEAKIWARKIMSKGEKT